MTRDTDQLEDRLQRELTELADHALVSDDAWSRVEDQASRRRWTPIIVPVAAVVAAVALVLAAVAILNAGDENTVAEDPNRDPFILEATSLPPGFARAEFEDEMSLVCSRLEVRGGEPECSEVIGTSSVGYRSDDPASSELFVAVTVGEGTDAFEITARALDAPEGVLAEFESEADASGGTVSTPSFERVDVRGDDDALFSTDEFSDTLIWRETPGVLGSIDVDVSDDHLTVDELIGIAEGLRSVAVDTSSLPILIAEGPVPVDPDFNQTLFGEPRWQFLARETDEGWCTTLDQIGLATLATPCEQAMVVPPGELSQKTFQQDTFSDVDPINFVYGMAPKATATLELVRSNGENATIEPVDFSGGDALSVRFYDAEIVDSEFPNEIVAFDVDGNELGRVRVSLKPSSGSVSPSEVSQEIGAN